MLSSSGFRDGLGERDLLFDRESGTIRERLLLRPELAAFEAALKRRVARLASFDDARLLHVEGVEHDRATGRVTVLSRHVSGQRLSEVLSEARERELIPDMTVALWIAAEVLAGAHAFHRLSGLPHGVVSTDRVLVTPDGETLLADYAYAEVLEAASFSRQRLWREFGIAHWLGAPFSFDADVRQAALVAIELMLGRRLDDYGLQTSLQATLTEVEDAAMIRGGRLFADPVMGWLSRAVATGTADGFSGAKAAAEACQALLTDRERAAARAALEQFIADAQTPLALPDYAAAEEIVAREEAASPAMLAVQEEMPAPMVEPDAAREPVFDTGTVLEFPVPESVVQAASVVQFPVSETPFEAEPLVEPDAREPVFESTRPVGSSVSLPAYESTPLSDAVAPADDFEAAPFEEPAAPEPAFETTRFAAPREPVFEPTARAESEASFEPTAFVEPLAPEPEFEPVQAAKPPAPEPVFETHIFAVPESPAPEVEPPVVVEPVAPAPALTLFTTSWPPPPPPALEAGESGPRVDSPNPFAALKDVPAASGPPPRVAPPVPAFPPVAIPQVTGTAAPEAPASQAAASPTLAVEPPSPPPIRLKESRRKKISGAESPLELSDRPAPVTFSAEAETESRWKFPRKFAAAAAVILVAGLAAGRVQWPASSTEAAVTPGMLIVETTPPGSELFIDGESRGHTPAALQIAPGKHEIKLGRNGATHAWMVDIASGARRVERLDWRALYSTGGIEVISNNKGSRVLVDGKARGVTPLVISDLKPGRHVVVVQGPNGNVRRTVRVVAGETTKLDLSIYSGWIVVTATVELDIVENGRAIGRAGEGPLVLSAGRHTIDLINKSLDYRSTHVIEIAPGEEKRLTVQPKGSLSANASPWAEVWVGEERLGETPLANVQVPLGSQEIVFKHPEYGERRIAVTITGGTPVQVTVDLTKP